MKEIEQTCQFPRYSFRTAQQWRSIAFFQGQHHGDHMTMKKVVDKVCFANACKSLKLGLRKTSEKCSIHQEVHHLWRKRRLFSFFLLSFLASSNSVCVTLFTFKQTFAFVSSHVRYRDEDVSTMSRSVFDAVAVMKPCFPALWLTQNYWRMVYIEFHRSSTEIMC